MMKIKIYKTLLAHKVKLPWQGKIFKATIAKFSLTKKHKQRRKNNNDNSGNGNGNGNDKDDDDLLDDILDDVVGD